MIFFSYKIKRQVFAQIYHFLTRSAFITYIPKLNYHLKEIMEHLNPNKHLNGTHISVTSPHFKTVSWKSKAKLCYHNLPLGFFIVYMHVHTHSE